MVIVKAWENVDYYKKKKKIPLLRSLLKRFPNWWVLAYAQMPFHGYVLDF